MNQENVAYDLSLFEPRPEKPAEEAPKKKEKPVQRSGMTPVTVVKGAFVTLIVTIAVGMMLYSRVQLTQINEEINQKQKALSQLKAEETRLNVSLDSKVTLKNVEDYAKNNLGLKIREKYQVQYITLSDSDKTEILKKPESANSFVRQINDCIAKIQEYFS